MDEQSQKQMDKAALMARAELQQHASEWRTKDVAQWWKKWYMKAGHKRLGRVLVQLSSKGEAAGQS